MDQLYYMNQISNYQNLLNFNQDQLRQKLSELEDLQDFAEQHQGMITNLREHFNQRRQRVQDTILDTSKVKCYNKYRTTMADLLDGYENQNIFTRKEEEQEGIERAITQLESDIQDLRMQCMNYESTISDLNYESMREGAK